MGCQGSKEAVPPSAKPEYKGKVNKVQPSAPSNQRDQEKKNGKETIHLGTGTSTTKISSNS